MCKTTTPPRPASQDDIRKQQPNSAAGAVIPLKSYLDKYVAQFSSQLVPSTPPTLPSDVDPNAYKRVAFSILPLLGHPDSNAVSPHYAGVFDDDMDFSGSLVKVAALFAAGQFLANAKNAVPSAGTDVFKDYNAGLKAEINANADSRILNATLPSGYQLLPQTSTILTGLDPAATFVKSFSDNLSAMIVNSSEPGAGVCIGRLGLGYISAVLNENSFFDKTLPPGPDSPYDATATGRGIWLTGDYVHSVPLTSVLRIPCVNDHRDVELTTTRQMCRMFSMIRIKQLPEHDIDTNTLMQNLLNEPKTGLEATGPWLGRNPGTEPLFTILQDKIGFAGLGTIQKPNVYSEGLIIKWKDMTKVDAFNKIIDPTNANPAIWLSGEIAVCWQNLLAELIDGGTADSPMFGPIVDVINHTVSDFLARAAL